jgi:DNA ligase-associated metallophosphoesterase
VREWIEVGEDLRITGDGAAWLPAERTVVIADVHLGYSRAARRRGGWLPEVESPEVVAERVLKMMTRLEASRLVIAGDLRHSTRDADAEEHEEVTRFLTLLGRLELALVRGNHDRGATNMAGVVAVGGVTVMHAPPATAPEGWTVAGHLHPAVTVRDEAGVSVRYPCALVGPKIVVLPAYSAWAGGTEARRLLRALTEAAWEVVAISGGRTYVVARSEKYA